MKTNPIYPTFIGLLGLTFNFYINQRKNILNKIHSIIKDKTFKSILDDFYTYINVDFNNLIYTNLIKVNRKYIKNYEIYLNLLPLYIVYDDLDNNSLIGKNIKLRGELL